MDKLKPIIDHHFWILLVIVLILPIIGWFPAVGQFNAQRDEKISAIENAFTSVPKTPQPNQSWSDGVNKIAAVIEEKSVQEKYEMWRRQEKMMTWPSRISRDLRPTTYFGDIPSKARVIYKNGYNIDVTELWKQVDPFDSKTGKGTVLFPEALMPRAKFGDLPPTSTLVWEAQEDVWLLSSLLKSIRRANSDSAVLTDSLVRSIRSLRLVGGSGNYPDAPADSSPTSSDGSYDSEFGMEEYTDLSGGEFGPDGEQSGSAMAGPSSAGFNPADEFGKEQGRYVKFEEGTLFKKRGFYMEAIIEHQRLPELLVHLSNGDWPVSITRVQMAQAGAQMGSDGYEGEEGMNNPYGSSYSSPYSETPAEFSQPTLSGSEPYATDGLSSGSSENQALATAAVSGPSLASVAISGVIFIYNPVEPPAVSETTTTTTPPPAETSTTETPADTSSTPAPEDLSPDSPMPEPSEPASGLESPEGPVDPEKMEAPAGTSDAAPTTEPELPALESPN